MKIENYIDCVNFYKGSNISKIKWMREDIIGHLPSKRILEASSILVVRMANDEMYLVKNRGNNDKNIEDIDFNVVIDNEINVKVKLFLKKFLIHYKIQYLSK